MMNKMLKTVTTSLLLTTSVSYAGAMGNQLNTEGGFYLAGQIGAASLTNKELHSLNPESHQLGATGLIGGGYVGYAYRLNPFGLGLEFFVDATGLNASIMHSPYTYQRQQRYDLGVRILPEYTFTPSTSAHVIFGYTNGKFNLNDNGVYGYIDTSYNQSGFQTGLGFTTAIQANFAVRLDAIYDTYGSQTNIGLGLTPNTFQGYTNSFGALAGELSLIYQFS